MLRARLPQKQLDGNHNNLDLMNFGENSTETEKAEDLQRNRKKREMSMRNGAKNGPKMNNNIIT